MLGRLFSGTTGEWPGRIAQQPGRTVAGSVFLLATLWLPWRRNMPSRAEGVMRRNPTLQAIGVLALQGDVREHLVALEQAGTKALPVRRLAEIEAVDGLVIPGG